MRFAHDYLDNQEVKREKYFLLPTSYFLPPPSSLDSLLASFSITSSIKGCQNSRKLYGCVQLSRKFARNII